MVLAENNHPVAEVAGYNRLVAGGRFVVAVVLVRSVGCLARYLTFAVHH